jgi:hypothetical protein
MRTFQDGMRVTFIGEGNTSLLSDVGTVDGEGDTVHVTYKHFGICLNHADVIVTKGQRVRLGPIAGTVLEPADIWQRADRLNNDSSLPHTTPVHWDDDTVTEEPTKNLRLSDIPAGATGANRSDRTLAVNAVIDSWWVAIENTGVYEGDINQLKRLLAHIR